MIEYSAYVMGPSILNDKFSQTPKLAEHGTELRLGLGTTIQKKGPHSSRLSAKKKDHKKNQERGGEGYAAGAAQALKV